jgi:23S rRNA (adenine2030-N6)-methyltransferase
MNYRHAFHAGNFADLVKHAVLLAVLDEMKIDARPITVLDTHAGAGLYDLSDPNQARSKEAEAGIKRLLAREPEPAFAALAAAVRALNGEGEVRFYPGSPWLAVTALRPGDRHVGCELRADDHGQLETTLRRFAPRGVGAEARRVDGYATALELAGEAGRLCVLIDPPFERPDDYVRAAETAKAVLKARMRPTPVMIWTPLKDLETLDGFLRRLEGVGQRPALVAEARLRRLDNPMKMNGTAMVVLNPPVRLREQAESICRAVVSGLGEPGGEARVWSL